MGGWGDDVKSRLGQSYATANSTMFENPLALKKKKKEIIAKNMTAPVTSMVNRNRCLHIYSMGL